MATVLLAEDNPGDQNLARRILQKGLLRCDLRIVSDGEEAVEYLRHQGGYADPASNPRPDLILLDINMPRLNGISVLRKIKSDPALHSIPVVMLTTSQYERDVLQSYELGCNSFISKPVDVAEFIGVLENLGHYWLQMVMLPPVGVTTR